MLFGGLQKNSLIDYPGKLSSVLFTSGCNFACPYCHNPGLINQDSKSAPSLRLRNNQIYDFLLNRKNFLDGVVISGGEPTFQKDLSSTCENIKKMGYPIKLDTNGSRPHILKDLIKEGLIDYIAMDIKADPSNYVKLLKARCNPDDIINSIEIIMNSDIPYEFRTTCVKPIISKETIQKIVQIIKGARLYALQRFHKVELLHPDFLAKKNQIYSDDELIDLKSVADASVKECIIR